MLELIKDCFLDALTDSAKLIPFLFVIYVLLEFFNRKLGVEIVNVVKKTKKLGPLLGAAVGVIPQCGLSAAAASLYAGKIISVGTMLAVFLSASDDMLPIFLSAAVPITKILKILALKLGIAIVTGYLIDFIWNLTRKKEKQSSGPIRMMSKKQVDKQQDVQICMASCCRGKFWPAVIRHTLQVFGYIFALSFLLNVIIGLIGEDVLANFFRNIPVLGEFVAALIGLIPNCASSVIITQLYLSGVMTAGALFSGLLVNAGVGLLVLIQSNKNKKENLKIIGLLYACGVIWGIILELLKIAF